MDFSPLKTNAFAHAKAKRCKILLAPDQARQVGDAAPDGCGATC
jgi:hypothetical protein